MKFNPRPKQAEVLSYTHGTMGISAVPGSGKTWTLSQLAAKLILEGQLQDEQEILVVTFANAAVENFSNRIGNFIEARGLPRNIGYKVRTLHGLSHDIIRAKPSSVNMGENFKIISEYESNRTIENITRILAERSYPLIESYLAENYNWNNFKNRESFYEFTLSSTVNNFIQIAKDLEQSPAMLKRKAEELPPLPLANFCIDCYATYQQSLQERGEIDFADLMMLAVKALHNDPTYLESLQNRWVYILEDEAQDSSRLQETMLRLLASKHNNWVRVGDPNQAIYESFTTANPEFLNNFIATADYPRTLPDSGRSTKSVIRIANALIAWTIREHPIEEVRNALKLPFIEPTPPNDPQPNPPDQPDKIHFIDANITSDKEIGKIIRSIKNWLPENQDKTVAILALNNEFAKKSIAALEEFEIPYCDALLKVSTSSQKTAKILLKALQFIFSPSDIRKLEDFFIDWLSAFYPETAEEKEDKTLRKIFRTIKTPESFLWGELTPDKNWFNQTHVEDLPEPVLQLFHTFKNQVCLWLNASVLPVDQLLITIGQTLYQDNINLAIVYQLAGGLRQNNSIDQAQTTLDATTLLTQVVNKRLSLMTLSEDSLGFDPEKHKGEVVICTMHKAKGLEWDRVYLASLNNFDIPSGLPNDQYLSESFSLRDNLNLSAEAIEQLKWIINPNNQPNRPTNWYEEGIGSREARYELIRDRLRLLYVGITRAKQHLVFSYNNGRRHNMQRALPVTALEHFWEENK